MCTVIEHAIKALRKTLLAGVVTVICISSMSNAAASCNVTGPAMLDLFLYGRGLGDAFQGKIVNAEMQKGNEENKVETLSVLDHALSTLNTQIWGLYWVSLYSRRLHEVLYKLDSKPPGPTTLYFDRWDTVQLNGLVDQVMHERAAVGDLLVHQNGLPTELSEKLQQYLGRISNELLGCAMKKQP